MLEPAKHNDVTAVGRPGLLAPDTSGMNFYRADPALTDLLRIHRVSASDPFRLTENPVQRAITDHLLGERAVGMVEVGELLAAA